MEKIKFMNDFVQAEMSNITNENSNPWEWKKGEELHQWTRNKNYKIIKVEKYPDCGIILEEVK